MKPEQGDEVGPVAREGAMRPTSASGGRPRRLRLGVGLATSADGGAAAGFKGACARDFADFVGGDPPSSSPLPPHPDPGFREGLRRRLWRMQVMARGEQGVVRH